MNRMRLSAFVLACTLVLTVANVADAGSVFLKNGYIIQGKVVERSDDQVVLGWGNGQMTIHRRFIDEVILDPREEEELRRERPAGPSTAGVQQPVVEQRVLVELPNRIEDIMPMRAFRSSTVASAAGATSSAGEPTERPEVTVTLPPMDLSAEAEFPAAGIALAAPAGWHVEESDGMIRVQKSPDAPFPSLLVSYRKQVRIDADVAREQLLRAFEEEVPGVSIVSEREQQIGFERALVVDGEVPNGPVFSEILIQRNDTCYLIGLQLSAPVEAAEQRAVQACLHSLRFIR